MLDTERVKKLEAEARQSRTRRSLFGHDLRPDLLQEALMGADAKHEHLSQSHAFARGERSIPEEGRAAIARDEKEEKAAYSVWKFTDDKDHKRRGFVVQPLFFGFLATAALFTLQNTLGVSGVKALIGFRLLLPDMLAIGVTVALILAAVRIAKVVRDARTVSRSGRSHDSLLLNHWTREDEHGNPVNADRLAQKPRRVWRKVEEPNPDQKKFFELTEGY